jgi:peptidoglycan/LPS O-acetylase OafA/YrhL
MTFRNDIQFLRGVSVIAVILFHINSSYLPGGFLGVDIFFIISGYLITNIIIKKKIDNNFSLREFYFARAKRILPALLFVLIITYIICYLTFLPLDLKIASRNSFFINLFLGNFNYYYFHSDYFSIKSSFDPYMHLWTLSLEEQFYLLYPILFIFFLNKNSQLVIKILFIVFIISISFYLFSKNFHSIFYLLHGRIWQLLLGGAISIVHLKKINFEKVIFNYLGLFGLILIISSFFIINNISLNNYRFLILMPSIGTFLIILNKKNRFVNIFESKLFVFLGSISYSLYLWHQPMLSFYKFYHNGEKNIYIILILLLLLLIISFLTKILIEDFFRNKFLKNNKLQRKKIFIFFSINIVIILTTISFYGNYSYGYPNRNKFYQQFTLNQIGLNKSCNGNVNFISCRTSFEPEVAILGNSYAAHLIFGIKENIPDIKLIQFTYDGCSPLDFDFVKHNKINTKCQNFNIEVYNELKKEYLLKKLKFIIIAGAENSIKNNQYKIELEKKLKIFKENNIKIIIVGNLPLQEGEVNVGRCFLLNRFKNNEFENCNYPKSNISKYSLKINEELKNFSIFNNVQYFDLIDVLCNQYKCLVSDKNGFYINDVDHFTKYGSNFIINNLLKKGFLR